MNDPVAGSEMDNSISSDRLALAPARWHTANDVSVGQVCLHDNPLLDEPHTRSHVKLPLLGHWGAP
ncbi:MAG: hypothetical protein ACRYGI_03575 [Janthinobacterium lividum]